MNVQQETDEIYRSLLEREDSQADVISIVAKGESFTIDGVMSPTSVFLVSRLSASEFDMNSWWVATPMDWVCPACGRKKIDIGRLNKKREIMCHLVEHHDHMKDVLKKRFQEISVNREVVVADEHAEKFAKRSATMISAYENTLICVDCNNADAVAKKASKSHSDFSYSPQELLRIIKSSPNKAHEIDVEIAKAIWVAQQDTFELRLKIANRIAEIAASNEHWYQHGNINCNPEVVERRAVNYVNSKGAYGVWESLKGGKKEKPVKEKSEWRQTIYLSPKLNPSQNEIEHAGQVGNPKFWKLLNEEWCCPGCLRNKREIVRRNKDGEWVVPIGSRFFFEPDTSWQREKIIVCGDCIKTAEDLGKEAASSVGKILQGYAAHVKIQEVNRCVIPRPHTRHNIDNVEAESILKCVIYRIQQAKK